MAGGAHDAGDDAALLGGDGAARARRRLGLARRARRPSSAGSASRTTTSTGSLEHVLGRRADARLARPRAGRRSRPAAARRADEPPRRRQPRVARDATLAVARRRRDPRRPRPLVPRGGDDRRARARGRPLALLRRALARVAPREGCARARAPARRSSATTPTSPASSGSWSDSATRSRRPSRRRRS